MDASLFVFSPGFWLRARTADSQRDAPSAPIRAAQRSTSPPPPPPQPLQPRRVALSSPAWWTCKDTMHRGCCAVVVAPCFAPFSGRRGPKAGRQRGVRLPVMPIFVASITPWVQTSIRQHQVSRMARYM